MVYTVALFGEAERGDYRTAYFFHELSQLEENLGNPPEGSQGIHFAIQTLLYNQQLIYFRVEEEGFSLEDYTSGLRFLRNKNLIPNLDALFLPGVGNRKIIEAAESVRADHNSLLIITEADLYDYLTDSLVLSA
jgi:hypothetical protein